jgi:CRP-like cAMP-binding protein
MPREADAHAIGETEVLVLGPGALLLRLRQDPAFALEMLNRLSGRVRTLNAQLGQALSQTTP